MNKIKTKLNKILTSCWYHSNKKKPEDTTYYIPKQDLSMLCLQVTFIPPFAHFYISYSNQVNVSLYQH